jgi:hypothetical protein
VIQLTIAQFNIWALRNNPEALGAVAQRFYAVAHCAKDLPRCCAAKNESAGWSGRRKWLRGFFLAS